MPPRAEPLKNALAAPSVSHRRLRSYVPGPTPRPVAILQLARVCFAHKFARIVVGEIGGPSAAPRNDLIA